MQFDKTYLPEKCESRNSRRLHALESNEGVEDHHAFEYIAISSIIQLSVITKKVYAAHGDFESFIGFCLHQALLGLKTHVGFILKVFS